MTSPTIGTGCTGVLVTTTGCDVAADPAKAVEANRLSDIRAISPKRVAKVFLAFEFSFLFWALCPHLYGHKQNANSIILETFLLYRQQVYRRTRGPLRLPRKQRIKRISSAIRRLSGKIKSRLRTFHPEPAKCSVVIGCSSNKLRPHEQRSKSFSPPLEPRKHRLVIQHYNVADNSRLTCDG